MQMYEYGNVVLLVRLPLSFFLFFIIKEEEERHSRNQRLAVLLHFPIFNFIFISNWAIHTHYDGFYVVI